MVDRNLANVVALAARIRPALDRGDRAGLCDIITQLITLRAPMGGQWEQIAHLVAGYGELTLARQAMALQAEAMGGGPVARFQEAAFLSTIGAARDADAIMRALPANVPNPATNAYISGISALAVGRSDEARQRLEQAIRMLPHSGLAWLSLAMTLDFGQEPALAERLIAAGRGIDQAPVPERAPYHYALGKAYADRGEHRLAFDAFARGARQMKAVAPYDHAADRADAARAIDGYSAERITAIAGKQSEPTARTIFVNGLPRSGTTLVEQILTSHSAVSDGGETSRLVLLANEVRGPSHAALARYVDAQGVAPAARLWGHWLDELYPASGRIVDKTVTTSRFMGLAAALLPEAPLIWMTRDPLDRAWSCFRTNFASGAMPWSYDLRDIAAHFRLEDQLLAQWRAILGDRLLVLSYEDLVDDPASWTRRILAHCGLAEEPAVFAPHENRRPVTTASMMQVRRPINRAGIGVAEPYREFLTPFIKAYGGG
jgi:hypothetical protein